MGFSFDDDSFHGVLTGGSANGSDDISGDRSTDMTARPEAPYVL